MKTDRQTESQRWINAILTLLHAIVLASVTGLLDSYSDEDDDAEDTNHIHDMHNNNVLPQQRGRAWREDSIDC